MKLKLIMAGLSLIGFTSIGWTNTKYFNHTTISVNDNGGDINSRYSISLRNVVKNKPNLLTNTLPLQESNPIWTFTTNQLPVTEDDCLMAEAPICSKNTESIYCYNHCLVSADPNVVAFDEKTNKLYFMVGTTAIGTGGGPAFLFVADVNKKTIKLLHAESDQEKASLSPSGKYLVINGDSIIKVYDIAFVSPVVSQLSKTRSTH